MKKFFKTIILFIFFPIVVWGIVEAILPVTFFTHRHFEAVMFNTKVPHENFMYPNLVSSMNAVGDMCHHSPNAVIKKEIWKTDKLGFRNDEFIEKADVLFVGDSFVEGSSLSQDETISNRVKANFGSAVKVYNMALSTMSDFDRYLKRGIIKKPKVLIFSIVERNVPPALVAYDSEKDSNINNLMIKAFEIGNINVYLDKAFKQFSIEWLKARIHGLKGNGVPGVGNPQMFFLNGKTQHHEKEDLILTKDIIISYKKYCDSLGIKFLFLPMPNKETVYFELVPFEKQPDYLFNLESLLKAENIEIINPLTLYNNYRKSSEKLLYHLDDTHWNPNATELVSKEIVKRVKVLNLWP